MILKSVFQGFAPQTHYSIIMLNFSKCLILQFYSKSELFFPKVTADGCPQCFIVFTISGMLECCDSIHGFECKHVILSIFTIDGSGWPGHHDSMQLQNVAAVNVSMGHYGRKSWYLTPLDIPDITGYRLRIGCQFDRICVNKNPVNNQKIL